MSERYIRDFFTGENMSKKDKCEVTNITINIGGEEKVVTIEQAKALKAALEELFGGENHYHSYWWQTPIYPESSSPVEPYRTYDIVWCDTTNMPMLCVQ